MAPWGWALARAVVAIVLALALPCRLLLGGGPALAFPLPWSTGASGQPLPTSAPTRGALQEVPPPVAVQQLQAALAGREPVVQILSPQDDALLGAGPWTLQLKVHDWPLVDGGALGLGPHLVVQLDQEPPRIWTTTQGELPELSPGSHRLTVYAALPWGEARKSPGAAAQVRLHRTAPNPLALPPPGAPQLLAVSPPAQAGAEPLLLDWLLLDAPLQNIGGSGSQWRLRAEINGDAVLLDQQTPLWLRGWQPGVNALRLELLDGHGDPLHPPFNALVREVDRTNPPAEPRWRGGPLSAAELAVLLGQSPAPRAAEPTAENATPHPEAAGEAPPATAAGAAPPAPPSGLLSLRRPEAEPIAAPPSAETTAPATPARPHQQASDSAGATEPDDRDEPERAPGPSPAQGQGREPGREGASDRRVPDLPPDAAASPPPSPTATGAAAEADAATGMEPLADRAQRTEISQPASREEQAGPDPMTDRAEPPAAAAQPAGSEPMAPAVPPSHAAVSASGPATGPPDAPAFAAPSAAAAPSAPQPSPTLATPTSETAAAPSTARANAATAAPEPSQQDPARGLAPISGDGHDTPAGSQVMAETALQSPASAPAAPQAPQAPEAPGEAISAAAAAPTRENEGRIRPSTELTGRARDLVNADGTLRQPERRGPLAALRERLQR